MCVIHYNNIYSGSRVYMTQHNIPKLKNFRYYIMYNVRMYICISGMYVCYYIGTQYIFK